MLSNVIGSGIALTGMVINAQTWFSSLFWMESMLSYVNGSGIDLAGMVINAQTCFSYLFFVGRCFASFFVKPQAKAQTLELFCPPHGRPGRNQRQGRLERDVWRFLPLTYRFD